MLTDFGIPFIVRVDGTPIVSRMVYEQSMEYVEDTSKVKKEKVTEPNFDAFI